MTKLLTKDLRLLLRRLGASTTGTKPILESRLSTTLQTPKLPEPTDRRSSTRVLSLDLGLRNLAFCLTDIRLTPTTGSSHRAGIDVLDWQRLVLAGPDATIRPSPIAAAQTEAGAAEAAPLDAKEDFSPARIAGLAATLVRETLLPARPDVVLLERQRWRSGGGAAVLEWTLRVNMLEQAIWACLECARRDEGAGRGFEVHPVVPARVAQFWCPEVDREGKGGAKLIKKLKIELLEGWCKRLGGTGAAEVGIEGEEMDLSFRGDGEKMRKVFLESGKRASRKEKDGDRLVKRDDVADCLLQALAWTRWETNRRNYIANNG
jgi:cruciform cutting endonuclease 1